MMVQLDRVILLSVALFLSLFSLVPCIDCFSLFHPSSSSSSSSSRHRFTPQADSTSISTSTSTSPSPSFPIPPTSYTCVVSINVPTAGYNLAYTEWSDGATNVIRTDGRFQPTRITQVIKDGYIYRWDRRNTTEPCTKTSVDKIAPPSNSTSSSNHSCDATLSSSSGIYDCFRDLNPIYRGTSYEARGIYCDVWSANATITSFSNFSFTIGLLFYFARDIPGIERVPVRAEIHANVTFDGVTRLMDQYWDWTAWTSGTQDTAIFNVPDGCTPSNTIPSLTIPTVSLVPPQAIQTRYVPPLPYEFSTVIETTSANIINGARTDMVTSQAWHFSMPADIASRNERVDYKDTDGKDVIVVYAYQRADTTTPPPGRPPNLGAGTSYTVKDGSCARGIITSDESSPLSTLRSGYTPTLFISPSLLAPPHYIYSGRQFARGVMCDTWLRIGNSWQRESYFYTFNTTIYFFPENYQFPGRDLPSGYRMPMRVVNDGVMSDADDTLTLYHDVWDFFLFNPGPQNYEWFNMTTQCPWVFVPDFELSASDAGATVAAIFGSLAGFACIVTVYNRWRRVQRMKRREHRKVLETLIFGGNKEEDEQKQEEMRLQQQQQMEQQQQLQQQEQEQEQEQEQQQEIEDDGEYGQPQESEQPAEEEQEEEPQEEEQQEDEDETSHTGSSVR